MTFFERLFQDEINWAFHTTMTCNFRYSIELAYVLAKKKSDKDILSKNEMK